jgi:hypothetical protein
MTKHPFITNPSVATMLELLNSLEDSFDWYVNEGADSEQIVRDTFQAYAPTTAAQRARELQAIMPHFAPPGMVPWHAIVTASGVSFRQG